MFVALLVTVSSVAVGLTAATDPVESHTVAPPLDDNETATLWSKDADTCNESIVNVSRATSETSAVQELANCTDITFKRPPRTAATWSEHDFDALEAGGENTSVHPPGADLTDSWAIADAHASVFAVHPSTRVHREPSETPLFIAPSGTVRGFVDYRIRSLDNGMIENGTDSWTVTDHEVSEVRLRRGSEVLVISDGSQTPVLEYDTNGTEPTSLTLEADIRVTLTRADRNATEDGTRSETTVDEVTVSDTIPVRVYEPAMERYSARYPNGDVGLALYQSQPWHGYRLTETGDARIRGIWRYYTARDTAWDSLVHSTAEESDRVPSPAKPVYVHAYPSEIGPRAEPVRDGPTILDVWGVESQSPASGLHENVSVEVVERPYVRSSGLALRASQQDINRLRIQGIVRGGNRSIGIPDRRTRTLRESDLSIEVANHNGSSATLRIKLTDATTGEPIHLADGSGDDPDIVPISGETRAGYLTLNGDRIETNRDGTAVVTVHEPGTYSVRYHPGSWLSHDPAYARDTASVSWHPLLTISGLATFTVEVVWWSLPFIAALYGGLRLGKFLKFDEYR